MGFCVQKLLLILDFHKARAFSFLEEGGGAYPATTQGSPCFPWLSEQGKRAKLRSVCIYNSFLSFDSFHVSTINSFAVETSAQLCLQMECLKAFIIIFHGKPTWPSEALYWCLSGKIRNPLYVAKVKVTLKTRTMADLSY